MEELRSKLDGATMDKLVGFDCPVQGCNIFIGNLVELKNHVKNTHKLLIKKKNPVPFICKICGSIQASLWNFERHHYQKHNQGQSLEQREAPMPNCIAAPEAAPMDVDSEDNTEKGITNRFFYMPPLSKEHFIEQASQFVTRFRCDVALPESKIQNFIQQSTQMLNDYQQYAMNVVKEFFNETNMQIDEKAVNMINCLELSHPFQDVMTAKDNLSYLCGIAKQSIPETKEYVLGLRKVHKVKRTQVSCGRNRRIFKSIKRSRQIKDSMHYIPVKDILGLIMQDPSAREMVENEHESTDALCGFKDGMLYRSHEFLKKIPLAVRLSVHIDDVEHCNPLGSRKGKQKITTISFKVQNFDDRVNSTLDRVYTVLVVRSQLLKVYGFKQILRPLLKDLLVLESDHGLPLRLSANESYTLHATVVHVLGDTLAIHELFELMPPQSNIFCRACYISRAAFHDGKFGAVHQLRTRESIANDLVALHEKSTVPAKCGMLRDTALKLGYFHFADHVSFDPMHDILEGVAAMVLKGTFNYLVNQVKSISEANKFNDESLLYITDDDLTKLGVTEMGPRLIIKSVISKALKKFDMDLSTAGPSSASFSNRPTKETKESACDSTPLTVREVLLKNKTFNNIVRSKLDRNIVPTHTEMLLMIRILCDDLDSDLLNNQVYPPRKAKKELARKIVEEFPILRTTKITEASPDYSMFFWKNGGLAPGHEHSGLIQTHLRNTSKALPPEKKKFTHQPKPEKVTNVSQDTLQIAQDCACKDAISSNFNAISKAMIETHNLHLMLVQEKRGVREILAIFPHLKSYNGAMIQKAYERLHVDYNKESNLKNVMARGLIIENESFTDVHDYAIRGCLRIFKALGKKGIRHVAGVETLPVQKQIAAPVIRWILDHPTALAEQLAQYVAFNMEQIMEPHIITNEESYYVYLQGEIIDCGKSSLQALDVFFKIFSVFAVKVPAALKKLIDFFEILAYRTKSSSTAVAVNKLLASFSESLIAERDSDSA